MKKLIILIYLVTLQQLQAQSYKIVDHTCTDLHAIPEQWINAAKEDLQVLYYRASHGTQLTEGGMTAIRNYDAEYNTLYKFGSTPEEGSLYIVEFLADLEHENDVWVSMTEEYLDENPEINAVMWAWCDIYEMDVASYLINMENLEAKYGPGGTENREMPVTFVYMTAHSWPYNGSGRGEWVFDANQQIREYCNTNNKWFYDFNDIECYDPDGTYFGDGNPDGSYSGHHRLRWDSSYDIDESTRGNWGIEWMNANPDSELTKMAADQYCTSCEHSDGSGEDDNSRLQCILKGNAAWWLWASLAGWNQEPTDLDNTFNDFDIRLFPNPAHNTISIQTKENRSFRKVEIVNVLGKQIISRPHLSDRNITLDISELSKGIYYLSATDFNNNTITRKFLVD